LGAFVVIGLLDGCSGSVAKSQAKPVSLSADTRSQDIQLVDDVNDRIDQALLFRISHKDMDPTLAIGLSYLKAFGFEPGSRVRLGDFDIYQKMSSFISTGVQKSYIDKSLKVVNKDAMLALFHQTFTPQEVKLIKCEVQVPKPSDTSERDRLLVAAGYRADNPGEISGKKNEPKQNSKPK
jgi:hypothetical protein